MKKKDKKSLKIGFDAKRLFNNFTGLGNYSRTLLKNLQSYFPQHEYHLYTPGLVENETTRYFLQENGFKIHVYKGPFKALWRSKGIIKNLQKDQIDIYHGLSAELPFGIHLSGIKTVVTIHDVLHKVFPSDYPVYYRHFVEKKLKYALHHADRVLAISEATRSDCEQYYPAEIARNKQMTVLYQAADSSYYQTETWEKEEAVSVQQDYILCIGSKHHRKNLNTVLESFRKISRERELQLIVVGINGTSSDSNVEYKSSIPKTELIALYKGSKMLIYPSLYEGFGLPVLEAQLLGVPVICGDVPGVNEVSGPGCIKLENPGDSDQMGRVILNVLDQAPVPMDSIQHLANFQPQYLTNSLMKLYLALLS